MSEFDEKLNALLSNPDSMAQIMQLAQSLSGDATGGGPPPTGPTAQSTAPPVQSPQGQSAGGGGDLLKSLTGGGLDPKLLSRLLPLVQEWNAPQDGNARQLLTALRPYLKPERQGKVERALQLARLVRLGRTLLSSWEG